MATSTFPPSASKFKFHPLNCLMRLRPDEKSYAADILLSMVRPNRRSIVQIKPCAEYCGQHRFRTSPPKESGFIFLFGLVMNKQFSLELEMLTIAAYPAIKVKILSVLRTSHCKNRDQISKILELLFNRNQI